MAILVGGRIVCQGTPSELIEKVRGRIWTRAVEPEELPSLRKQFALIATRLRGGRNVINVLADHAPDPRFEPVEAGLEDVYFSTLHAHRHAAEVAAMTAVAGAPAA
jgi:hypothetical protein